MGNETITYHLRKVYTKKLALTREEMVGAFLL